MSKLPGRTTALIVAPTLAGLVGLLSGCGGSSTMSRSAYRAELTRVSRQLSKAVLAGWPRYRGLLVANPPLGTFQVTTRAEIAADRKAARELAVVKAPADAAADNAKVVRGLRAQAAETAAAGFTAPTSPAGVAKLAQKTEALQDRLRQNGTTAAIQGYEAARTDLEQRGYWPNERRYVIVVSAGLGNSRSPCALGPQVIPPFVEHASERIAIRRLERSGFRVAVTRKPSAKVAADEVAGESPSATCLGAVVHIAVSTGSKGVHATRPATSPVPQPFALVSRSGRQPAKHVQASLCTSRKGSLDCSYSSGNGNLLEFHPASLSVVRRGEQVTFALPRAAYPQPKFAGIRFPSSLMVYRLCDPFLPVASTFVHHPRWTVSLRPGQYTMFFEFVSRSKRRFVTEGGAFGLAVSNTQPLGIVRAPKCS